MDRLEIRPAGPPEANVLAALIGGFRDHLRAKVPTDADLRRHLPDSLADPGIEFACAWLDERAVGYVQIRFLTSIWVCGTEAFLEDLFVIPSARRRSIGRSLFRFALARAETRGTRRFSLTTNEGNEAAQSLYRSEGLTPHSHALYPVGREVLWVKRLGPSAPASAGN